MPTLARAPALARFPSPPGMTDVQLGPDPVRCAVLSRRIRLFAAAVGVAVAAGLIWYAVFTANKPAPVAPQPAAQAQLVREDSHRLTSPATEKAQLVEFLDFECESCRAAHPLVEELKEEHGDRITFVNRYFPSPDTGTRVPLPWRWRLPRSKAFKSRWQRSCSKPRPSGAESRTDRHPCSGATRRNWDWTWPGTTPQGV